MSQLKKNKGTEEERRMKRESFKDDARPQKRARDQPTEQPSEQLAVAATEAAVTCTVSELQALFTKEADEHEFDCPVSGCHGKIVMNADLCRFGHGVKAMCRLQDDKAATASSSHHSHISKWCRVMYSFIPAEMWVEHLSCCSGLSSAQAQCAIVDVETLLPQVAQQGADSQTRTADDASSAVVASENGEEKCYGRGQAAPPSRNTIKAMQRPTSGVNGNDSGASDSGIDVLRAQIADGFDESIIHLVERELKAHESNIVLGDQERSQWVSHQVASLQWGEHQRELQRQTVISGLKARAMFPKPSAAAAHLADKERSETTERSREGAFFHSVAAGDVAAVRAMLQSQDLNLQAHDGFENSALHWAAATGCAATCRALLDGGMHVGARGARGHTALHIAAIHGRNEVVDLLVARGGNLDEKNNGGLTPRHLLNIFFECHAHAALKDASLS